MKIIILSLLLSANVFSGSPDISDIVSSGDVSPGNACFDECKDKKAVFGVVGSKKDATERKSCVSCLTKYPDKFKVRPEFLDQNGYYVDIKSDAGNAKIRMGDACYSECQPQKEFVAVGKTEHPLDNPSCAPCIRENNKKYKFNLSLLIEDKVKCQISSDKQYAYCDGDTYKLDSSINSLERSMGKDIPNKLKEKSESSKALQR